MLEKSETVSQQGHKVVILREIGNSWEKSEKNRDLPPDLQPNQCVQFILIMAAWRVRNGVEGPEDWIMGTDVTSK